MYAADEPIICASAGPSQPQVATTITLEAVMLWYDVTARRTERKTFTSLVRFGPKQWKNIGWAVFFYVVIILIPWDFFDFLTAITSTTIILASETMNLVLPQSLFHALFIIDQIILVILTAIAVSAGTLRGQDPIRIEEQDEA